MMFRRLQTMWRCTLFVNILPLKKTTFVGALLVSIISRLSNVTFDVKQSDCYVTINFIKLKFLWLTVFPFASACTVVLFANVPNCPLTCPYSVGLNFFPPSIKPLIDNVWNLVTIKHQEQHCHQVEFKGHLGSCSTIL